jgi:hypothetical protein
MHSPAYRRTIYTRGCSTYITVPRIDAPSIRGVCTVLRIHYTRPDSSRHVIGSEACMVGHSFYCKWSTRTIVVVVRPRPTAGRSWISPALSHTRFTIPISHPPYWVHDSYITSSTLGSRFLYHALHKVVRRSTKALRRRLALTSRPLRRARSCRIRWRCIA